MHLTILTPNKKVFEGNITTSKFPGELGLFQVLKGHAPIISILKSGNIIYQANSIEHKFSIESGIVEVLTDNIIVLIDKEKN
jgi:F-type H+-transporting ATPase subunit epsilon